MADLCQRWNAGQHSWRHRSDGGFDRARYEVAAIDRATAKRFVIGHHYSGSYPAGRIMFGLYCAEALVGVAVLSTPVASKVLTSVFPGLVPSYESIELGRFVLLDAVPANGESYFLGQVFRLAAAQGIRGVVSFSDPVPRRAGDGRLVMPGHVGTIYQATNARYLGRNTARSAHLLPDGTVLNARSLQKVRRQEQGREYVERLLVAHGAVARARHEDPTAWLGRALVQARTRCVRHAGKHRYAFVVGRTSTERRHVEMAMIAQPFPKSIDQEVRAA